jgi:hypothetical protein
LPSVLGGPGKTGFAQPVRKKNNFHSPLRRTCNYEAAKFFPAQFSFQILAALYPLI